MIWNVIGFVVGAIVFIEFAKQGQWIAAFGCGLGVWIGIYSFAFDDTRYYNRYKRRRW